MKPVTAATRWRTNADMIVDVARLGYIGLEVIDLSYGKGAFWSKHQPASLTRNDLNPAKDCDNHFDVNHDPPEHWKTRFDTAVWDGDYRLGGRRDRAMDDAYGTEKYKSIDETMRNLRAGIRFATMVTKRSGTILVKCQDQTASGQKQWQTIQLANHGVQLGLRLAEMFHMVGTPRPQPEGRVQKTARSNYSTLLVFVR